MAPRISVDQGIIDVFVFLCKGNLMTIKVIRNLQVANAAFKFFKMIGNESCG